MGKGKVVTISICLPEELLARMERVYDKKFMTRSQFIVSAIVDELEALSFIEEVKLCHTEADAENKRS